MNIDRDAIKTLAESADIVNTINGGTVYPTFDTTTEKDHYRLEVNVPTVNPNNIKVEVDGSDLLIYQSVKHHDLVLPNLLGMMKISADVELDHITAGYEEDTLIVILPFDEETGGFRKEIDIIRQ
jgi:HSP20 family molecular chaperone IbpA